MLHRPAYKQERNTQLNQRKLAIDHTDKTDKDISKTYFFVSAFIRVICEYPRSNTRKNPYTLPRFSYILITQNHKKGDITVLANVRLSVSRFLIFISVAAAIAAFAAFTVSAAAGDYNDVFCGTAPAAFHPEPVVLAPHTSPMTVNISIADFAFDPPDLTINVGDTVVWTNNDGTAHSTTSDTGVWDSGLFGNGGTFSFTFNDPGQFPYHCSRHGSMTATVTVMNAASPTPTPAISGTVTYGNAVGNPSPRFVSNVLLSAAGSQNVSTTTSFPAGTYTLTGFGTGSYTVTPTKTDGVNGITSFDAARVAQHAAGIMTLTGNQLVVADTSGNGAVTSFDAAQIARFASGGSQFGLTGTWKFIPANHTYASIVSNVTGEDFVALLMGEVTGNWANNAPNR